jgi:hypothetical protein
MGRRFARKAQKEVVDCLLLFNPPEMHVALGVFGITLI